MKVALVGFNALSALLASNLARAKNDVWLLDNDQPRVKRIIRDQVKIEGASGNYKSKINATTEIADIGEVDAVFILSRSYDTENMLKNIKPLLRDNTYVVSLQSGLGNLQLISEHVDPNRVIGGVTREDVSLISENHIRHNSRGETIVGQENKRVLGAIREISSLLSKASFKTKISKDINSITWSNLIIDIAINPLSAITRLNNGMLLKNEYTKEIMRRAVSEAVKVAKRKKVKLTYDDPIQKVETVCRTRPDAVSPMLDDVISKRMTEIDFINGAIVRQAKSLNIKTPTNEMLAEIVKSIETNYENLVTS